MFNGQIIYKWAMVHSSMKFPKFFNGGLAGLRCLRGRPINLRLGLVSNGDPKNRLQKSTGCRQIESFLYYSFGGGKSISSYGIMIFWPAQECQNSKKFAPILGGYDPSPTHTQVVLLLTLWIIKHGNGT